MGLIKLDLHVHTVYSKDALIKPSELILELKRKKMDGCAVCDHNSLKAYSLLKKKTEGENLLIIPGMELETDIGEILALFVEEQIDLHDTRFFSVVDQINDKNGIIVIPHPFDFMRRNHLKMNLLSNKTIKTHIDGIEVINSRIIFKNCITKAAEFAEKQSLFKTGGSDAHTKNEIGHGFTLIKGQTNLTLESVRNALLSKKSESGGKLSSPLVHVITIMNKLKKGLYF